MEIIRKGGVADPNVVVCVLSEDCTGYNPCGINDHSCGLYIPCFIKG